MQAPSQGPAWLVWLEVGEAEWGGHESGSSQGQVGPPGLGEDVDVTLLQPMKPPAGADLLLFSRSRELALGVTASSLTSCDSGPVEG